MQPNKTNKTIRAIHGARMAATLSMAFFATSAVALTPGSGTWVLESATYGTPNLQNAYVYVPSNTNPAVLNNKRALMLSLHGCGQTADGNVIGTKFNWQTIAEQKGMVVVAPTVPSGTSSTRTSSGCWDWFGANHSRTTRDAVPLKKLIDAVKGRANLDIDPNQIYITGLSSGAGETHVIGCSFPDYFAGIGENAGPALGSGAYDIFSDPKRTAQQVADTCKAINGNNPTYNAMYATQLYNTVYGANDTLVKPSHNVRNADGMCKLYGMTTGSTCTGGTSFTVTGGGVGTMFKDANGKQRVSRISVTGMAHAWPAGSGGSGGGSYVDYTKINYPVWITNWFFNNNLRVGGGGTTTTTTAGGTTTTTTATTTTTTASGGACYTASNYTHSVSGRAYVLYGLTYANGSNQSMGLWNTFTITKLRNTGSNYYIIDSSCP